MLEKLVVPSLYKEREVGRSLALIKPKKCRFSASKRDPEDVRAEAERFEALRSQGDLFSPQNVIPYAPCPYLFKYKYTTDDGEREGSCQDWETDAT